MTPTQRSITNLVRHLQLLQWLATVALRKTDTEYLEMRSWPGWGEA